jgi:hypothetical protein
MSIETPIHEQRPGHMSVVFGALFAGALTLILMLFMWAVMESLYGVVPAVILGGALFGFWALMAHQVRVDARREQHA